MFGFGTGERGAQLRKKIKSLEADRDRLTDRNSELNAELRDQKHTHKLADEDVKHMIKMRAESLEVEFEKKKLTLQRESDKAVASAKDGCRDKMEAQLGAERDNIKSMYESILQRLPKMSVRQMGMRNERVESDTEEAS